MEEVSKLNPQGPDGAVRNKVEDVIKGLATEAFWSSRGVWNLPPGFWGAIPGLETGEFCDHICALKRSFRQLCRGRRQEAVMNLKLWSEVIGAWARVEAVRMKRRLP